VARASKAGNYPLAGATGWFRTQLLREPDIKIITITEFRRFGRKVRLLEVEMVDGRW